MNDIASRCIRASAEYAERGRVHESLLLLERAMLAAPDDADIVLHYAQRAEAVFGGDDPDTGEQRLEALEALVRSRVLYVSLDRVDDVVERADALRGRRESTASGGAASAEHDEDGEAVRDLLRMADEGKLGGEPPADDLDRRLRLLERARDEFEVPDDSQREIAVALERAHAARTFDVVAGELQGAIELIAKWANPARAARALQHVDSALGPLVAASDKLDGPRLKALDALLDELRDAAADTATKTHEAESADRWSAFSKKHASELESVLAFEAPSENAADGACQKVLERARAMHEKVIELLPLLRGSKALELARTCGSKLAVACTEAAQSQQRRYDKWAMLRIRHGYEAADKHIGMIDDEKKLGDALVHYFGEIDTRFLSHEVQRCYTEVFDLLYGRLKKPSKASDFDTPGSKLNVLKRMFSEPKHTPSNF